MEEQEARVSILVIKNMDKIIWLKDPTYNCKKSLYGFRQFKFVLIIAPSSQDLFLYFFYMDIP